MVDGLTVLAEQLRGLIDRRVCIQSSVYPDEPAIGILWWVGWDDMGLAAFCAQVKTSIGTMRYVPLPHIVHFEAMPE